MRILIVGDPLKNLNPKSDSSFFMARAALKAGHEVHWCEPKDVALYDTEVLVRSARIAEALERRPLKLAKPADSRVSEFASVWIRKDPPFDSAYVSLCWMLSLVEKRVSVVNPPSLLLRHHEKLLPLQAIAAGFLAPTDIFPTFVAGAGAKLPQGFPKGPAVAKPWLGYGGRSIKKFASAAAALKSVKKGQTAVIQPFVANIAELGDRRVIFVGGEYAADFVRIPKKGSFVANLAQGGTAVMRGRSDRERELCDRIGAFLKASGIHFAGVDLIGHQVTEMNVTSPTGLQTLVDLGGPDLGPAYIKMAERAANAR